MTRKDYMNLARALAESKSSIENGFTKSKNEIELWEEIVNYVVMELRCNYSNFDKVRFYEACDMSIKKGV